MAWLKAGDNPGDERTFECRVTASYLGEIASTGNEYIEVMFAEKQGAGNQSKKLFLTDSGFDFTEKCLKILGWDPAERDYMFEELGTGDESPLVGSECEIVVLAEKEQDGDRIYNNVAFINALGGGGAPREKMSREEAEGFAERVRRKLRIRQPRRGGRDRAQDRKERVRGAAAEGARRQGAGGHVEGADPEEDDNFDDIPF